MKKLSKILIILSLILIISLTILLLPKSNKTIKVSNKGVILNNKNIALMIEQNDGHYEESTDTVWPERTNYIFNPFLSKCDKGGKLSYDDTKNVVNVKSTKTEKCYLYFDEYNYENYCKYSNDSTMVCDILRNKNNSIIYHDGLSDYDGELNVNLEAGDLSYRYTGEPGSVDNYVCFGSDDSKCPDDNLYRIIGLFKNDEGKYEIKLIKDDYARENALGGENVGSYYNTYLKCNNAIINYNGSFDNLACYNWNSTDKTSSNNNDWKQSNLNNENLNKYYLDSYLDAIDIKWAKMISSHNWLIAGANGTNINQSKNVKMAYDTELVEPYKNNADDNKFKAQIGLMYVSDYLYSASSSVWNTSPGSYRNVVDKNWMYKGLDEWTISKASDTANRVYLVYYSGFITHINSGDGTSTSDTAVRPVFYLNSNVKLISGTGEKSSPYRVI